MSALIYALILFVIGFLLLLAEIFLAPGINLFGIGGIGILIWSIAYAYSRLGALSGNLFLIGALGISFIVLRLALKSKLTQKVALKDEARGYSGTNKKLEGLASGMKGVVKTPLRPAGLVQFERGVFDAVSEGEFVEKGTVVEIVTIQGQRVLVRQR